MTIGQAIQESQTTNHVLHVASTLIWLPTDEHLKPHLKSQAIHAEKRIRSARWVLLESLHVLGLFCVVSHSMFQTCTCSSHFRPSQLLDKLGSLYKDEYSVQYNSTIWSCPSIERAALAAALPFETNKEEELDVTKQSRNLILSLTGLHTLAGTTLPESAWPFLSNENIETSAPNNSNLEIKVAEGLLHAMALLIKQTEAMARQISLREAVELRWAIRGLVVRFGMPLIVALQTEKYNGANYQMEVDSKLLLERCTPTLDMRVQRLPFDIIPLGLDWNRLREEHEIESMRNGSNRKFIGDRSDIISTLLNDVPFNFDEITTRTGSSVKERRGTAWVASEEIGALAYSGKLMLPRPIPPIVARAMRHVEYALFSRYEEQYGKDQSFQLDTDLERMKFIWEETGKYFDCALCNHYPNDDSACKFHTDPEHGSFWERLTCVVSSGKDDVRKFAFRPIPDETCWSEWDKWNLTKCKIRRGDDNLPAVIQVS